MHIHYFSSNNGDELNHLFQNHLLSIDQFKKIAQDIFLFSTEVYYERERQLRIRMVLKSKQTIADNDKEEIDKKIRTSRSITPINTGDLDLTFSDGNSERLNAEAIKFLISNSNKIDYISGLKKAEKFGYDIRVEADVLMFGEPLKVSI